MDYKQLLDLIYGPLPKSYCMYFHAFSIFLLSLFLLSFIFVIMSVLGIKSIGSPKTSILISIGYFINYMTLRMLHTMCVNSLT